MLITESLARAVGVVISVLYTAVACRSASPVSPTQPESVENVRFEKRCGPGELVARDRRGVEMLCASERPVFAKIFGTAVCGYESSASIEWEPEPHEVAFELEELNFDRISDPAWFRADDEKLAEQTWQNASRFRLRGVSSSPRRQVGAGAIWRWRAMSADGAPGPWLYAAWACSLI